MIRFYILFIAFSCLFIVDGRAQTNTISGIVNDSTDQGALIGVNVLLIQKSDTTQRRGAATDLDGRFTFVNTSPGVYYLRISYIGYSAKQMSVDVKSQSLDLGTIPLQTSAVMLKSVQVTGTTIQVEQKGDTTQYNANAFKTGKDASAEDLITKMPGLTSDNTGLKAQGENVQKVLVDGKEFFGDDAAIALKNLPAEVIEKIEVFDRLSEQAQLTGFDDGQTVKTLNIVTRKGKNNGTFGRVYAGAGEDGKYSAGGNINVFSGSRRISLIGLSNNINQQNFSNEDLLGVTSASSGGGGGGRGRQGGGGGPGGGGGGNNFAVGQQNGISTTNSIGFNYSDQWGKKTTVTGSYFFNKADNENMTDLNRQYILQQDSGLVYAEMNRSTNVNYNHRVNFRVEYKIDSVNSLVLTPRLSFQNNDASAFLTGRYTGAESDVNSELDNRNLSGNEGYTFSNNLVFRHRFAKRGRSMSIGVNTDVNNRDGDGTLQSTSTDRITGDVVAIDQNSTNFTDSYTISPNLAYTEPVGKRSQLQFNYTPTYRKSKTDKRTYNFAEESGTYSNLDTLLTNAFDNTYTAHRGGLSYRFNDKKLNFNAGVNYQASRLKSDQDFPIAFQVDRSFQNIIPQLTMNYKFTSTENLRFTYRTNTNAPSVSQLQNVVDNRNPLFLKTGNPNLSQDYSHAITLRYGRTNINTSTSLLALISGSFVQDYITNTSIIAPQDTTINSIFLSRGSQLSYPVNVNGYRNARALLTYGLPVKYVKSNLNFTTSVNYNRIPALINGAQNLANNYALSQGVVVASNISENLDFTLSYTANYTIVKNSLQKQSDNNYLNQLTSVRLNWIFWKGFVFTSNLNHTMYKGLSAEFDQSIWFWNAGLGYKFLKDQSLEVKVNAFDILNQNNSISRDVTETYIEDRQTNVLTRYFMLVVTYRISQFKGGPAK